MHRTMIAFVALALATPAFAQQQGDAQLKAQVEQIVQKWNEAVNAGDGNAVKAFLTPDYINIDAYGMTTPSDTEKMVAAVKKMGIEIRGNVTKVEMLPGDKAALAFGTYHVTYQNNPALKSADGNWVRVLVKDGSDWKVKAASLVRLTQPEVASGTSSPSSK